MFINPVLPKMHTATPLFAAKSFAAHPLSPMSFDSVHFGASSKKPSEESQENKKPEKTGSAIKAVTLLLMLAFVVAGGRQCALNQAQINGTNEATKSIEELEASNKELEQQLANMLARTVADPMSEDILSFGEKYPNVYYDKNDKGIEPYLPLMEKVFDAIFSNNPNLRGAFDNIERFCLTSGGNTPEEWQKFGLPSEMVKNLSRSTIYGHTSTNNQFVGVKCIDPVSLMDQVHEFCHTLLTPEEGLEYDKLLKADLEENLDKLKQLDTSSLPPSLVNDLQYAVIDSDLGFTENHSSNNYGDFRQTKENFAVLASYLLMDKSNIPGLNAVDENDNIVVAVNIAEGTKLFRKYFPESCKFIDNLLDNSGTQEVVNEP